MKLMPPQMEYTRFSRAAGDPPRANALRGLTDTFFPGGFSHLLVESFKMQYDLVTTGTLKRF